MASKNAFTTSLSSVALATGLGWLFVNILWAVIKYKNTGAVKSPG